VRGLLATWLLALMLAGPVAAQPVRKATSASEEVSIEAQSVSYNQRTDTVTAKGGVVIHRGDTELRADEVELNRATNDVFARGDVTVTDPTGTLFADQVHLNLDEETGTLVNGTITSRRLRYSLRGDRIEKGLGQSYHIENGRFTTCHCEEGPSSWSIAGKQIDVTLGGYGKLVGGTFNILDVPVLYLPQAVFPVNQERQSGFLLPRFSVSNRRGFQALAPFYWAINRSQDLTVAPDFETGARVGMVGQYRYALSPNFEGEISPSYFNEFFRGAGNLPAPNIPTDRWSVVTEHTNSVGPARMYADLFLTSDDAFLREINTFTIDRNRDIAIRTLPFTTSRVGLVQSWDRAAVRLQGTYYQNLVSSGPLTLERLPDAEGWGQWLLGDHLIAHVDAMGTDFQRRQGIDGLRLDLRPEAVVPVHVGPAFYGSIRLGLRETAYHLTNNSMTGGFRGDDPNAPLITLPQDRTRETLRLTAEASTSLSRIYSFDRFGITKLKHTIEPLAEYIFVPGVSQGDLPLFDGADRDNRRSLLTYGVVSRLLAKYAPSSTEESTRSQSPLAAGVRELARLSLMQSFDTQREIPAVAAKGAADHFSDVDLGLRLQPSSMLSLAAQGGYDTSTADISSATVGFRLQGAGREDQSTRLENRNSIGVTYRFITSSLLQQVDSDVQLRLTDTLGFVYADRVDVLNDRFLENYFGLRLLSQCDCWGLDFAVVDKTNPQEIEVRAQLTLVGLGSTGSSRTSTAGSYP
jgi:LPS-assembly protein